MDVLIRRLNQSLVSLASAYALAIDRLQTKPLFSQSGLKGFLDAVGNGTGHEGPKQHPAGQIHLSCMAVAPERQGRGVGKRLMGWVKRRCVDEQVPLSLWSTSPGQKLYRSVGCRESGAFEYKAIRQAAFVWWPEGLEERELQRKEEEDGEKLAAQTRNEV